MARPPVKAQIAGFFDRISNRAGRFMSSIAPPHALVLVGQSAPIAPKAAWRWCGVVRPATARHEARALQRRGYFRCEAQSSSRHAKIKLRRAGYGNISHLC
jgi:hypothetical protein